MLKLKFFSGKIASTPIVVPMANYVVVFVVVDIENIGRKKLYSTTQNLYINIENTVFSDVAVSSVGDKVRLGLNASTESNYINAEICSFVNDTLGFGKLS
ncbi:MAG: hypothetical protein IKW58_00930 [Alphaproteobacteria bacterium]|nr:hypothetical protein [Alphaproteobacteria bacterium]